VEGLWSGSGSNDLILSFRISHSNGQAILGELTVLWLGPGDDCTIDLVVTDETPIQPENFTRFFENKDIRYNLTGRVDSATLIVGEINLHYTGCSDRSIRWIARPRE
jgi:hypothetical protein